MQNKRIFAGRFFELFTLPGSLRLNTQRGSAQGMRAFKEEERSVLIQFLWHKWKELQGTKLCHLLASSSVCKWRVHSDLKERFLSFVCLFIIIFLPSAFIVFFLLLFLLSAFSHPHPPSAGIWSASYRHPITVKTISCEESNTIHPQILRIVYLFASKFLEAAHRWPIWSTSFWLVSIISGDQYLF